MVLNEAISIRKITAERFDKPVQLPALSEPYGWTIKTKLFRYRYILFMIEVTEKIF